MNINGLKQLISLKSVVNACFHSSFSKCNSFFQNERLWEFLKTRILNLWVTQAFLLFIGKVLNKLTSMCYNLLRIINDLSNNGTVFEPFPKKLSLLMA